MTMERPLSIGYITVDDPRDRRTWSGTNFFLMRALEQRGAQVVILGPLKPQPVLFLCRVVNFITTRLLGRRFNYRDSTILSRAYARMLQRRTKGRRFDLLLAPAGLATMAYLRTELPIVYVNDRCMAGALGYHRILRDLFDWSARDGLDLERRTLEKAALSVFASDWAADAARIAAPAAAGRVRTIPMGANLDAPPPPPADRAFPPPVLKLLFLGVDWADKGGDIAYAALRELRSQGHRAQLVVCGCDVPASIRDADVVREGFLRKSVPGERARLEEHLRTADLLILPTRFEAYGIAFCEAAAYGVPALGTRTGGVPTIVVDGETGHLFAPEEGGRAYASRIIELVRDPGRWQRMRTAARARYERVLTWEAFVDALLVQCEAAGAIKRER